MHSDRWPRCGKRCGHSMIPRAKCLEWTCGRHRLCTHSCTRAPTYAWSAGSSGDTVTLLRSGLHGPVGRPRAATGHHLRLIERGGPPKRPPSRPPPRPPPRPPHGPPPFAAPFALRVAPVLAWVRNSLRERIPVCFNHSIKTVYKIQTDIAFL